MICNETPCETPDVWGDANKLKAFAEGLDPLMRQVLSANDNECNAKKTAMGAGEFLSI